MKPLMIGLHRAFLIKHIYIAGVLSCSSVALMYFCRNRPRVNKFKKYYEEYDPVEAFDRISSKWVLDCCPKPPPSSETGGKAKSGK